MHQSNRPQLYVQLEDFTKATLSDHLQTSLHLLLKLSTTAPPALAVDCPSMLRRFKYK